MSLPDTKRFKTATLAAALLLGGGLVLSGCQVRPLYGSVSPGSVTSESVKHELAAVQVSSFSGISGNTNRVLLTELSFALKRGSAAPEKRYRLEAVGDITASSVGIESLSDVPAALTSTMNVTFVLYDIETEKTLMSGKSFASASYDFSSQRFANTRAQREAEERVAREVARDITSRLAGYFATRK